MDILEASSPARSSRAALLVEARERLTAPVAMRGSVWPPLMAAAAAAAAALTAAAAVILGGPALGAASEQVHPAVSHQLGA